MKILKNDIKWPTFMAHFWNSYTRSDMGSICKLGQRLYEACSKECNKTARFEHYGKTFHHLKKNAIENGECATLSLLRILVRLTFFKERKKTQPRLYKFEINTWLNKGYTFKHQNSYVSMVKYFAFIYLFSQNIY